MLTLTLSLTLYSDDFFAVKDRIIEESRFKLGFLYLQPLLLLENVGYTSSIYTYEEKEYPDWTGDAGVGLRVSAIAANRLILQAEDLPHYSFYLENKNLRSWSNRFEATGYSYLGRFHFKAGFRRHDLNQRPNLEFSRPYRYVDSAWTGAIDFGRHDSWFLTATASFSELSYDRDPYLGGASLADSLNHKEDALGLRLNKRVFTDTIVYVDAERSEYRFAFRPERNARAQRFALGVEFPEIGALQGSFRIGIRRFEPSNPLFRDVQRPNGRGDVHFTVAKRLRLSVFYELDMLYSYGASDLFYDSDTFGGGVEAYVARFLKLGANHRDGWMKYRSFLDLEPKRRDRVRQQQLYLAVPFIGRTAIGLAYNIYRLTSNVLGLDYVRHYWGGFLSYEF